MTLQWLRRKLRRMHEGSAFKDSKVVLIDVNSGMTFDPVDVVFEARDTGGIVWIKMEEQDE